MRVQRAVGRGGDASLGRTLIQSIFLAKIVVGYVEIDVVEATVHTVIVVAR